MLETLLAQTGSIDGRVQELETSRQTMENQIQEFEKDYMLMQISRR